MFLALYVLGAILYLLFGGGPFSRRIGAALLWPLFLVVGIFA